MSKKMIIDFKQNNKMIRNKQYTMDVRKTCNSDMKC